MKRKIDIWRLFNPATDFPTLTAMLLGLLIVIFIDDMMLKFVGVCVMVLGGLGLFMFFSQRLKEYTFTSSKPTTETAFKTTVKQDSDTKRLIFDDFPDTFGSDDFSTEPEKEQDDNRKINDVPGSLEKTTIHKTPSKATPILTFGGDDFDIPSEPIEETPQINSKKIAAEIPEFQDQDAFSDGASVFTILGPVGQTSDLHTKSKISNEKIPASEPVSEPISLKIESKKEITDSEPDVLRTKSRITEEIQPEDVPPIMKPAHKRKKLNIQLTDIFEETPNSIRNEPRKEFDHLLQRVLMVIRSVISARTAAFVWINFDKKELVLEANITDIPTSLRQQRKLPLANDVVSQIAKSGTPEILTEINPSAELDLIPYYHSAAQTSSFVGVPVYFNNAVVGVLIADSPEEDAYDAGTVSFLGQFTKLIHGLIQGYTDKYDLLQSARALEAIDRFRRLIVNPNNTKLDISAALIQTVDNLIAYSNAGVVTFNEDEGKWLVSYSSLKTESKNLLNKEISLDNSLIGRTIGTGKTFQYFDLIPETISVCATETPNIGGTAAFVPIKSPTRCYGAMFVEFPAGGSLTQMDIDIFEMLAQYAGTTLEQLELNLMLQSSSLVDETGIANTPALIQRLDEEFARSADMHLPFSVCMIKIDQYSSLFSSVNSELADITAAHVINCLEQSLRSYDIVGRFNENIIGVGLIQKNAREAQMWAERVRKEIASSVMRYKSRQYSVTVSIGVAEFGSHQTFEELLASSEQVLQIASMKTNSVNIFG